MAVTAWNSSLRDRTDNRFVIGDELQITENNSEFQSHDLYPQVFSGSAWMSRDGNYSAQQTLSGPHVNDAVDCVWQHAHFGDQGLQSWNASTEGAGAEEPAVCRPLIPGIAAETYGDGTVHTTLAVGSTTADVGIGSGFTSARIMMRSRRLFLAPVFDYLDERGTLPLSLVDPVADGVPEEFADEAELEWEPGGLEIVKVEVTGDNGPRPAEDTITPGEGITIALRDVIAPTVPETPWHLGEPGMWDDTRDGRIEITYRDGDPVWTEITGLIEGPNGADLLSDTEDEPDEVIFWGMETAFGFAMPTVAPDTEESFVSTAIPAIRVTLRSPRYRWVYPGLNPVIRQYPRDDGRGLSGAPRLHPPVKASRLAGGYQ